MELRADAHMKDTLTIRLIAAEGHVGCLRQGSAQASKAEDDGPSASAARHSCYSKK